MGLFEKDKLTERDHEITRLYKELSTVVHEVNKILDTEGPNSPLFKEFDGRAQTILRRVQQMESGNPSSIEI